MEKKSDKKSYEKVLEYVKASVLNGELKIGSRLEPERQLAAKLNVGRYSVREALRVMEDMGIVQCRHGDGNYISGNFSESLLRFISMFILLKKPEFKMVNSLRRGLEGAALMGFINMAKPEAMSRLELCIENMKNGGAKQSAVYDSLFHRYICELSGNSLLSDVLCVLSEATESAIGGVWVGITDTDRTRLIKSHEAILGALVAGNSAEALAAMRNHYDIVNDIYETKGELI